MVEPTVNIDLEAANPLSAPNVPAQQVKEKDVVFVAFKDIELTVNREILKFVARNPTKVTRDQARILKDANAGYIVD